MVKNMLAFQQNGYQKIKKINLENFLKDVKNWDNHRPFLFWALENTKDSKSPILELGCGYGSTPYLLEYCKLNSRKLLSYDFDLEWAKKYDAKYVNDWDSIKHIDYSVALIDHSPAERRHLDIELIKEKADFIIIHDTESPGYLYDRIWHHFPYRRDLFTTTNNHTIQATIVSTKRNIPDIIFEKIENKDLDNKIYSIDYKIIK